MAARPKQRDGIGERAAYLALRTAMILPHVAGPAASLAAARGLGRAFGAAPFNRSRVERAAERIDVAMPGLTPAARGELVLRSYEHLAMLAVEVAMLGRLITPDSWQEHVQLGPMADALRPLLRRDPVVLISGHTGNWEVLGATMGVLGFPMHALYRPLDIRPLDRWLRRTRAAQGIELIDKFGAADRLPALLDQRDPVAFIADQNAGDKGVFVPFFGRLASAYKTIALLTLTHGATVLCGQAMRLDWDDDPSDPAVALGRPVGDDALRYRMDIVDQFGPDEYLAQPDPAYYITARYRRAIETMVRRAPEQYLWMHRAWKSRPLHERRGEPFPPRLRDRLSGLPWMTDHDVQAIVDRSDADAALLARLGTDRLP